MILHEATTPFATVLGLLLIASRCLTGLSAPHRPVVVGPAPDRGAVRSGPAAGPRARGGSITIAGRTVLGVHLAVTVGLGLVAVIVGPFPALICVVVVAARPVVRRRLGERRRRRSVEGAVPDTIDLLVSMMHAGLTPHQAVLALAEHAPPPTRVGFVHVVRRLDRGERLGDALAELVVVCGPAMASVADTVSISVRHGSPIADALIQLSFDARERRRRLAEADARRLPVRLSFPLVFCTLPSFVLVAIAPAVLAAVSSLGDISW